MRILEIVDEQNFLDGRYGVPRYKKRKPVYLGKEKWKRILNRKNFGIR